MQVVSLASRPSLFPLSLSLSLSLACLSFLSLSLFFCSVFVALSVSFLHEIYTNPHEKIRRRRHKPLSRVLENVQISPQNIKSEILFRNALFKAISWYFIM